MSKIHYWGFRIDTDNIKLLWEELDQGWLRQGWGWDTKQDLRLMKENSKDFMDEGAGKNKRMFDEVKKGHILLVPELPDWGKVAVVRATENWDTGYKFDMLEDTNDHGHTFPAEFVRSFVRRNAHVDGDIRTTLKARNRFWNMDWCGVSVEKIINAEGELCKITKPGERMQYEVDRVFCEFKQKIKEKACEEIHIGISETEWEHALVDVLQELYPYYDVERVGGKTEACHGTDVLLKIPGMVEDWDCYGIAIQIKDHDHSLDTDAVIAQVNKADDYWNERGVKIIEKVVVATKVKKSAHPDIKNKTKNGVKFILAEDLKEIIGKYVNKRLGVNNNERDD